MPIEPIGQGNFVQPPSSSSLTAAQQQEMMHLYATLMGVAAAMADGGSLIAPSAATPLNQLQSLIAQLQQQLSNPEAQALLSKATDILFYNQGNNAANNYQVGSYAQAAGQALQAAQDISQAMTLSGFSPTASTYTAPSDVIDLIYGMSYAFSLQAGQYPVPVGLQQSIREELLPLLNNPAIAGIANTMLQKVESQINEAGSCPPDEIAINLEGALVDFEQSGLLFNPDLR